MRAIFTHSKCVSCITDCFLLCDSFIQSYSFSSFFLAARYPAGLIPACAAESHPILVRSPLIIEFTAVMRVVSVYDSIFFSGVTFAAKGYFDALVRMGELASESQGSKDLGECRRPVFTSREHANCVA